MSGTKRRPMFTLPEIILGSGSAARASLLRAAGLDFTVLPAEVDERAVTAATPEALALTLSEAKARDVSARQPGALVIGADQVLALEGEIFHKAATIEEARAKLRRLSGKTHALHSGAAVARGGEILWAHVETARLTMRVLSEADIDAYTKSAGAALTSCVGAYAIEAEGAWLFERIEGDSFTIQGLPLLPLLGFLRSVSA